MKFPHIKTSKVDDLIPYVNNSRTHSDEQVAQVAASIKEFGFTSPILVDGNNGVIAGHGRLMAARKIGIDEVPTIELSHLTETQKKAYIIADNKLALNAGWDEELLHVEMEHLDIDGFDMSIVGFSDSDMASIMESPIDIEEVDHFNESINISISCEDLSELALMQDILGITGKKIDAKKIIGVLSENSDS